MDPVVRVGSSEQYHCKGRFWSTLIEPRKSTGPDTPGYYTSNVSNATYSARFMTEEKIRWIAGLENRFREQHLASVQQFRYMPSFDNLPSMMAVILMGIEELIANKDQGTAKELEELLAHAAAEVSNGVAWLGPSVEVIGRRAW